jgi:hypothetical protein
MNLIYHCLAAFLLLIVTTMPALATGNCSYAKSVQQKGTVFDISSRPVAGCAVQIISVAVRRGGKKIAAMKADVDYLAQSARAIDLNGDGSPELAIISRTTGGTITESLDVYWLDGTALRRTAMPELEDKSGYRGGDRFSLEDRLIVRTVPVYRDADPAEKPTGGARTLKYDFKDGAATLYVRTENTTSDSGAPPQAETKSPAPAAKETAAPVTQEIPATPITPAATPNQATQATQKTQETPESEKTPLTITAITATATGIEIKTNGADVTFKTLLLDKPERIAIDIPGADSPLVGKKVAINRFGLGMARVGRNKGVLRIVLDMTKRTFESFKVKSSGSSVLIEFMK